MLVAMFSRRLGVVVLLLVTAFGFTAALTWQAINSAREHRAAAESVVRDYAAVVADDLLHRIIFEFESFGLMPIRSALFKTWSEEHRLMPPAELNAPLAGQAFVADFAAHKVDPPLPDALQRWVLSDMETEVKARIDNDRHYQIHVHLADGDHYLGFVAKPVAPRTFIGFTLRPEILARKARRAFERRTPFPGQMLASSQLESSDVYIHIANSGAELLRTPGTFNEALGVRLRVPQPYGDLLAGSIVETSFKPSALPNIVAGGLPPSRKWVAALMLVSSMFVLAAIGMILHRERQLDSMRSDFISAVSHELRTPLTQIRMFSETLLMNRVRSDTERQRALQIVNQETTRLGHLVDNILLLSRRERGTLALSLQEIDVVALVTETLQAFDPMIRSSRARVVVNGNESLIAIVDRAALKQVLINFLDNAVKYGPAGQTITLTVTGSDAAFRIDVDDEGPGIPAEDRDVVWQKFYRLERDREGDKAGSGIGLAVSADIIERHGGRYWIGDAPSKGARFSIEVPRHRATESNEEEDDRRFYEQLESSTGHRG